MAHPKELNHHHITAAAAHLRSDQPHLALQELGGFDPDNLSTTPINPSLNIALLLAVGMSRIQNHASTNVENKYHQASPVPELINPIAQTMVLALIATNNLFSQKSNSDPLIDSPQLSELKGVIQSHPDSQDLMLQIEALRS